MREIEEENIKNDDEDINELEAKFSKHKNNNIKNPQTKNDIFLKCEFDKNNIQNNSKLLSEFEKQGLIQKNSYFSLDKNELADPIDPSDIKKDNKIKNNYIINDRIIENSDLYCGYIDHMNLQKFPNKNKNSQISCPYCFSLISNNILENHSEKGYVIIGKSEYIFKNYSLGAITLEEANKLFKGKISDIDSINKKYKEENEKNMKIIGDKLNGIDNIEKIFIQLSCVSCGNIIGVCNAIDNTKIIVDYL